MQLFRDTIPYLLSLLALLMAYPAPAVSQKNMWAGSRFDIGADLRYWSLTSNPLPFTGQTCRGIGIRAGLRPDAGSRYGIAFSAGWAPQGDFDAGTADLSLDFLLRFTHPRTERSTNGFLMLSAGALHIDATAQQATAEECDNMPGCMLELELLQSGTRPILGMGLGLELPFADRWLLQPEARILALFNNDGSGFTTERYIMRLGLGVGMQW